MPKEKIVVVEDIEKILEQELSFYDIEVEPDKQYVITLIAQRIMRAL